MTPFTIPVVFFSDLDHSHLNEEGFTKISYGDATYTLVQAVELVRELSNRDDCERLAPLINELNSIPSIFLIALDG